MVRKRFHGLKKPKVRQSWNKFNLYNLARQENLKTHALTFFQQKWAAKSMTRAYHGEQIRERQWTRMFKRYIPAVVEMDAAELAKNDGTEQAAGRGTGKVERPDGRRRFKPKPTPYMNMTYYPTERRLDTAIFRALFASSTRQARQFVVHGYVKVNGKKMPYPGYLLNPGDMFSVDPERVMFATGAPKGQAVADRDDLEDVEETENGAEEPVEEEEVGEAEETDASSEVKARKDKLKALIGAIDESLLDKKDLSGRRLQELRTLRKEAKKAMSRSKHLTDESLSELESQHAAIVEKISQSEGSAEVPEAEDAKPSIDTSVVAPRYKSAAPPTHLDLLNRLPNPRDPTKPYATPWRPRPYMSAFAFIPRYLEVNQNVCSAVYLRHPVARPGLAEVPTPFASEVNTLAFQWYLRRR
ncbi:alpha-L RNA-binding motif-containing protein [Trichodelitschia bisporula]|uniref:Small ribosomal subunit protein uS4m n=1 Tax=Trichodelitschia bisporula TaxID=703511 RepID=A0A6G1I0U5_9PEZI|nr:alpha-L RNA-binding motif-containing protein [Trichodelitschia bisporula]